MARRTVLFSPGDRPERCRTAPSTGADTVVFDLEDAVAPARRAEARAAVADLLADPAFDPAGVEVAVRVAADPDAATTDLDALAGAERLDAVMVPKADVETVRRVADTLASRVPILALVETATGILDARDVAAVPAVDALCFGAEDLAADLGASRTAEGTEVLYAREHVVLAARAAGVDAVDTVYTDLDDRDGLRSETRFAGTLGYDGKMVVHPDQVPVVHEALAPDDEDVAWAKRVLAARDAADADGRAVFEVDGEMIDAPLIARAERIVDRADDEG